MMMGQFLAILFCFSLHSIIAVSDSGHEWTKIGLHEASGDRNITTNMKQQNPNFSNRKILPRGECTPKDLSISQSTYSTTGIPQYVVEILNTCTSSSGCAPSNIHLHCGWFASARLVNPNAFKRLSYDDCLVNGGKAMKANQLIRFTYSNTFKYPLSLKSAKFC
ncbi:unnamed protein product [Cuscuta epithymum]|uniref:Uncharacterized protein n=1 Tax=Cuscuta epithymum TaxID=186058 RepID=A0AAV0EEW4_9ASTE|nr:unnamed protein product [Cuscuta epithymum]